MPLQLPENKGASRSQTLAGKAASLAVRWIYANRSHTDGLIEYMARDLRARRAAPGDSGSGSPIESA